MKIGIPKEIKNREYRVAATPDCVRAYVAQGNSVLVQADAGLGAGFENAEYEAAGARLVADAATVWASSDMIVKVKEPLASEYDLMRPNQLLYTYLHLAAVPELAVALIKQRVTAVAYETIELADRSLPCLDCKNGFVFSAGEQEFFEKKGFREIPKRCKPCRDSRKAKRSDGAGGATGFGHANGGHGGDRALNKGGSDAPVCVSNRCPASRIHRECRRRSAQAAAFRAGVLAKTPNRW